MDKPPGVGAEIYHKFMKHLGPNTRCLLSPQGWSKKKFNPARFVGSSLSKELFHAIRQGGYQYISVYFHQPEYSVEQYAAAMQFSDRRCLVTVTEDGYVVNIYTDMWYKGVS